MMNYEDFKEELVNNMNAVIPEETGITVETATLNSKDILKFCGMKKNASPTMNVNSIYEAYIEGIPLPVIVRDIMETFLTLYKQTEGGDFEHLLNEAKENRSKVALELMNYEKNAELLKALAHVKFLDLAIIFKIPVSVGSLKLTNQAVEQLKTSTDELFIDACKNIKAQIVQMPSTPLWILTTREFIKGAGAVLHRVALDSFCDDFKLEKLILLPSSVNEFLIHPYHPDLIKHLKNSVQFVNEEALKEEEFLSNNAYFYDRKTREYGIL